MQHAIDAEAHLAGFPARLQVDIAGPLGKRILQNPVHDIDDVLVVRVVMPLAHFQQLLEVGNTGHFLAGIAGGPGDGAAQVVELHPVAAQLLGIGQHHLQLPVTQHLLEMGLPVAHKGLVAGHHHLVPLHFHRNDAVTLGKGITHHIGHLIHMDLERINVTHRHTRLFPQPAGQEIHIQQLVGIGPVGEPILGQHLNRVPIQLLLLPWRGGNDVEVFLADATFFQQLTHQPAHINQQTIQFGGVGSDVHGYSPGQ